MQTSRRWPRYVRAGMGNYKYGRLVDIKLMFRWLNCGGLSFGQIIGAADQLTPAVAADSLMQVHTLHMHVDAEAGFGHAMCKQDAK